MLKKIWVYGSPFSGKTTFATKAADHFVLSTDGNAQYTTDSYKVITDEVTVMGRITKRKLAWEVFKEEIEKLEAGGKYKTIIVDLVEDTYEMCRIFMYQKLGISHESDDSFRAWDKVRTEYLSTMRRLLNLPYDIILISHEDMSKDITKKSGENITAIKPNITDKVANKLAGMVALVGRTVVEGDKYTLQIKTDEVTFGGGRLGVNNVVIPLEWDEVVTLFDRKQVIIMDITITRDDYKSAVDKAQEIFLDQISGKGEGIEGVAANFMMGLQNIAFAIILEKTLFGE